MHSLKPDTFQLLRLLGLSLFLSIALMGNIQSQEPSVPSTQKVVLAHYMPWFEAKPTSGRWGWHWTMNAVDPDKQVEGKRSIASHHYPLIGPYDSSDRDVIEYHLATMKLAGIDGVIVDWYGLTDFRDYAILHRNTTRVLEAAERLQMKFVICYEDQTIPALVEGKRISEQDRISHAASEIEWLGKYWFRSPSYCKWEGKPVLLSFGLNGLKDSEWTQCLQQSKVDVSYFSQQTRRQAAIGGFDWPIPADADAAHRRFALSSKSWPASIPVVYPRFVDFYAEAKVGPSYGTIADDGGIRYRKLLETALESQGPIVQLATWNDWGEGTEIEPSVEYGYRDLETTLSILKKRGMQSQAINAEDLRLPKIWLEKTRSASSTDEQQKLREIILRIANGELDQFRTWLVNRP